MEDYDKNTLIFELNKLAVLLAQKEVSQEQVSAIREKIEESNVIASDFSAIVEHNQKEENYQTAESTFVNRDSCPEENISISDSQCQENTTESEEKAAPSFSPELLTHVDDIRSGKIEPVPISEKLEKYIVAHDQISCSGHIANEDLWNGNLGWKSVSAFYSMISYVWCHAQDFFVSFDFDRAISEQSSQWNQSYFVDQLNYLRHNFSIERLCHLVMVYEFLHEQDIKKAQDAKKTPAPKVTLIQAKSPFADDSDGNHENSTVPQGPKNTNTLIVICGVIIIAVLVFVFLMSPKKINGSQINHSCDSSAKYVETSQGSTQNASKTPAAVSMKEERMETMRRVPKNSPVVKKNSNIFSDKGEK